MNDTEIDRLIAAAASTTTAAVRGWDLGAAETDLLEEIMSTDLTPSTDRARDDGHPAVVDIVRDSAAEPRSPRGLRRHRRFAPVLAVAAAVAVVVGGVAVARSQGTADVEQTAGSRPTAPSSTPSYTPEDVAAAGALPHLFVDLPGWSATGARPTTLESRDPITATGGQVDFAHGDQRLTVTWMSAEMHQMVLDQIPESTSEPVAVAGHEATLYVIHEPDPPSDDDVQVEGLDDHAAVWLQGDFVIAVSGSGFGFGSTDDFKAALAGLVETDTEPWMDAVSPAVVWPSAHAATVDTMLADIPAPPGLDVAPLRAADRIGSRRGLAVEVTRRVMCTWIGSWVEARDTGDDAGTQAAVDALSTARDWDVLVEMDDGWSGNAWDYADAVVTGAPAPAGSDDVTVEESYETAFGC